MLQTELQDCKYREKMFETKLDLITVNFNIHKFLDSIILLQFNLHL